MVSLSHRGTDGSVGRHSDHRAQEDRIHLDLLINVSYHYANVQLEILVGMTNTTKVLVDINLAVQYWNVIHVQCHNIGSYKDGLPICQI